MLRNIIIIAIAFFLLLPGHARAGNIPDVATSIAKQLDKQLMQKFASKKNVALSQSVDEDAVKSKISIAVTTPVNLNDLSKTCPLARQVAEEITTYMVSEGYAFEEMRKGKEIIFTEKKGETILTRNTVNLAKKDVTTSMIMVGTYIITREQVRFNIKLLSTGNNEVLAMGSSTISITRNLLPLLVGSSSKSPVRPSIGTRLQ